MTPTPLRRGRFAAAGLALLSATLVPGLAQLPAVAAPTASGDRPGPSTSLLDPAVGLDDLDARGNAVPSPAQRTALKGLGAVDARFNRFGTPSSILPADGSLGATTSSNAEKAARAWLGRHAAAFGLSTGDLAGLELVNVQRFAGSGPGPCCCARSSAASPPPWPAW